MTAIFICQVPPILAINNATKDPMARPPGNHTWNRLSMVALLSSYMSEIIGLYAASTIPLPKLTKKVERNKGIKLCDRILKVIPNK